VIRALLRCKKWLAAIGIGIAAILAMFIRGKGMARGARKERLRAGKEALRASEQAMSMKRSAIESTLAHEAMLKEAAALKEVLRAEEAARNDPTTVAESKSRLDNELRKG